MPLQRGQFGGAELAGQGERLLGHPPALVRVLGVQQRGVASLERGRERLRLADPAGHPDRLAGELGGAARGLGEDEVLGQARQQAHAQRAVARLEARERLLEQGGVGVVRRPGRVEAPARAERRACEPVGGADGPRQLERLQERRAGVGLAGLPARRAQRQQHVAAGGGIVAPDLLETDQRALVVHRRVLVGVRRLGGLARPEVEDERLGRAADGARLEVVVGDLGGIRRARLVSSSASAMCRCRRSLRLAIGRS